MKKIQFFTENESWYVENGIPYMFGLLLHGEPGCGKTSTIKAIANMTQRHIGNWLFSAPFDSLIIGCNFRIQLNSQKADFQWNNFYENCKLEYHMFELKKIILKKKSATKLRCVK